MVAQNPLTLNAFRRFETYADVRRYHEKQSDTGIKLFQGRTLPVSDDGIVTLTCRDDFHTIVSDGYLTGSADKNIGIMSGFVEVELADTKETVWIFPEEEDRIVIYKNMRPEDLKNVFFIEHLLYAFLDFDDTMHVGGKISRDILDAIEALSKIADIGIISYGTGVRSILDKFIMKGGEAGEVARQIMYYVNPEFVYMSVPNKRDMFAYFKKYGVKACFLDDSGEQIESVQEIGIPCVQVSKKTGMAMGDVNRVLEEIFKSVTDTSTRLKNAGIRLPEIRQGRLEHGFFPL